MKVLWLCNIMIPFIAKSLKQNFMVKEGWLSGLSEQLIRNSEENNITLAICFPASENCGFVTWDDALFVKNRTQGIDYYIFREDTVHPECYDMALEESLKAIVADFDPDVVHIFGTEFPHALAMTKAWGRPNRTLVGIQGLCSEIAKVYMNGLPYSVQKKKTFRDIIKKDGLQQQQQKFVERGKNEIAAIQLAGHITGRTDFDREVTAKINPNAKYHFMNETLRDEFYQESWNIDKMERYSIFLSQANYPVKGFHYVLEALPAIVEKYPQTKVYIAGDIITANSTLKDKIKISGYGKYLLHLIKSKGLEKHIVFMGSQPAGRICARLLKTHVFLCPSTIENSPNSVGEAMLLGVPVVSADVGGVHNLMSDRREGLLYAPGDIEALQKAILRIFADDKLAMSLSTNAKIRAEKTHDAKTNYLRLLEIYHEINGGF